jgi:lysophospholipase L1-like esterase
MVPASIIVLAILLQTASFAAHAVRIVTFGDSLTAPRAGVITYSEVLSRNLTEKGIKVEVINAGVPGDTSTKARARFATDVLARSPNLVIIQLGANDAAIDVWKAPPATQPRVSKSEYGNNLRYFIQALRERSADVILMTPNRFAWTPKLRSLYSKPPYDVSSDDGFNFMLDEYSEIMRDIALRERIPLIDCAKHIPSSALLDGMHPSSTGHRIVADLLLPVVRSLLLKP